MPTATAAETKPAQSLGDRARRSLSWMPNGHRPVSADSVAVFRIGFGVLVAFSSARFLAKGWVDSLYLDPAHHLTYGGFEWVRPLPAPWMHLHVLGLGMLGLCIAAGYRHRLATGLFLLGFSYTELIEASLYLNHYWFLTLTAATLLVLPVHHRWSLDARSGRVTASATVPVLTIWALRSQLAVVYIFAGLAKLNADWLIDAQPLQLWLADRAATPLIGGLLDEVAIAYLASWSAAAFDLTIVAWLCYRPSRNGAYAILVLFHLATGALFQIGVFPLVMIVATLIFFEPDWPTRLRRKHRRQSAAAWDDNTPRLGRPAAIILVAFAAIQLVIPLRHLAYPGNVRWTEEGYHLSWRVMLTDKAGHVTYTITDPSSNLTWETGPEIVLTDWQRAHAATRPDLIHATAKIIAEHYASTGRKDVQVRADAWVSMNGSERSRLIDQTVDLAATPRNLAPSPWILERRPNRNP